METNVSLPITMCEPRAYIIEPTINRFNAVTRVGAQADKFFRLQTFLKKGDIDVHLIQRRLAPFWIAQCKSRFHYDRATSYAILPQVGDAVEIIVEMEGQPALTLPVDPEAKGQSIFLWGKERCITERTASEFVDAYEMIEVKSGLALPPLVKKDDQARFRQYISTPSKQVDDFSALYQNNKLDGDPIYNDLQEEAVQVVLPSQPANRVVAEVMKKVMVTIDPIAIYEWSLAVERADMYLRPLYVFEFARKDKDHKVVESKLGQLDAITGEWNTISSKEIAQSGRVPWDNILNLTVDASVVVMQELGGPWLKISTGLFKVGAKHVPGIVKDIRGEKE